jgi:hypothetical protein
MDLYAKYKETPIQLKVIKRQSYYQHTQTHFLLRAGAGIHWRSHMFGQPAPYSIQQPSRQRGVSYQLPP